MFVGNVELLDELCDETRFNKQVSGGLAQVRNGVSQSERHMCYASI